MAVHVVPLFAVEWVIGVTCSAIAHSVKCAPSFSTRALKMSTFTDGSTMSSFVVTGNAALLGVLAVMIIKFSKSFNELFRTFEAIYDKDGRYFLLVVEKNMPQFQTASKQAKRDTRH